MSNYTNKNNVEKYLGEDIPDSMDAYIESYLDAVDNWLENYIGRSLKDGAEDTKYYDTKGEMEIWIDDFEGDPTVTTLDIYGDDDIELTLDSDYYTYPLNETRKNRIKLIPNSQIRRFSRGSKRLKVVANFGLASIPADITLAATMLLASILSKYTKGGDTKSEKVGDTSFTYKDVNEFVMGSPENQKVMGVFSILDQYRLPVL